VALAGGEHFVLTGGVDRHAKLWRIDTGDLAAAIPHPDGVAGVAFAAPGAFLTLDGGGTARVWDLPDGPERYTFGTGKARLSRPVLSADGNTAFAVIGEPPRVVRWSVGDGGTTQFTFKDLTHFESVRPLAVGPGGIALVAAQTPNATETWLVTLADKQARTRHQLPHPFDVTAALFRPDGPDVLTWGEGTAQLWNADTGQPVGRPIAFPGVPAAFAVRPDGNAVIVGGAGTDKPGLAQVWSLEEKGDRLSPPLHHAEPVVEVSFEPDGTAVRTRDSRHTVTRWEVATGHPLDVTPLPAKSRVVAISPKGDRHVVLTPDGVPHLYIGGDHALIALQPTSAADWRSAHFSDDGQTLVTGWADGVRLWDARTGLPLGPVLPFRNLRDAVFANSRILAWQDTEARLWRLPKPPADKADDWRIWLAGRTGLTRTADGAVRLLDAKTWTQRRDEADGKKDGNGAGKR
jgi:WD40 repeat protein